MTRMGSLFIEGKTEKYEGKQLYDRVREAITRRTKRRDGAIMRRKRKRVTD